MRPPFRLERGASVVGGGVRFGVWAPRARSVAVRMECGPEIRLREEEGGVFAGEAEVAPGADYRYALDGGRTFADPVSRHQPQGVFGPSRVVDPEGAVWTDAAWRGVEPEDLVIYELHVGCFTGAGSFEGAIRRLPELADLGVTALELMPVAQFPGRRNWGYDGVFPYAPQDSYGGPEGLRRLVDAAHAAGLAVLLDVVYNHLGPEGSVLAEFGPYFTDRYRTPWGAALNFDGEDSDEVRRYFIDNALYWVSEYHLDGLRLDAVHAIHDASALHFLEELARELHALGDALGRRVHVIAESDANDPRLVRPTARGGLGLDALWNDDFHHALHVALTGEGHGYYADYDGLESLVRALGERFVYHGRYSRFRRRRFGAPADALPGTRFVVFSQNHDQVGNRAHGERLSVLVSQRRLRLAAALVLLSASVPLLFMGEEYGERAPFLYFVDHASPELREAVGRGRRREFAAFHRGADLPDPADPDSFARSRLTRDPADAGLWRLYRDLLALRRIHPGLGPGARVEEVSHDAAAGWIRATLRSRGGGSGLAVFHLGSRTAAIPAPAGRGRWELRLSTADPSYGGVRAEVAKVWQAEGDVVVPPETALLYVRGAG